MTTYCSFCSLQLGFIIPWHSTFTPAVPSLLSPTCSSVRDGWALRTERRVSQLALVRLQFCSLQERGKCTPRITEVLLRELYLLRLELGKDTTALMVHNPLGSGLSRLVPLFYRYAITFYQLHLCHKQQLPCFLQ